MAVDICVLIVDDSNLMRRVIRKVIGQAGLLASEVLEASNGQEALDIIAQKHVDLVFSNINMPQMNGIQMLSKIRETQDKQNLPVIMITAEGTENTIMQAAELGASGYVLKPFTAERLAYSLRKAGVVLASNIASEVDLSNPAAF